MKLLIVKADTNDGDYVHKVRKLLEEGDDLTIEIITKVSKVISKSKQHHNWDTSEYINDNELPPEELYKEKLTPEEIDIFNQEAVPYGEYGIHTIVSITIYEVTEQTKLL